MPSKNGQPEQRNFSGVELRAAVNELALVGIAAAYGVWSSDLGGYRETIAPGAFARCLRERRDVKCLFNHDANHVLGRVKNGTLTLTDTPQGLAFRCQLNPADPSAVALHARVKRGDIDECSFAFTVSKNGERWAETNGKMTRTLLDVDLYDVSAVCYPAYPDGTEVDARKQQRSVTHYVVQADWRSSALAKLRQLDAQYDKDRDAHRNKMAALIAKEIED